jgi:hypothetical protein
LFFEAARGFFPNALVGVPKYKQPAPWLNPGFVKRNRAALCGYEERTKILGPLPSFQANVGTLDALRRQLACDALSSDPLREKRYPYLDRGLLEFMFAVPREQLVRPGQRRSLMRRALFGVVPDELLNRKRKAYVVRATLNAISDNWAGLAELTQHMVAAALGIVDANVFSEAMQKARHGEEVPTVIIKRTLGIESWLQNLRTCELLSIPRPQSHSYQAENSESAATP